MNIYRRRILLILTKVSFLDTRNPFFFSFVDQTCLGHDIDADGEFEADDVVTSG